MAAVLPPSDSRLGGLARRRLESETVVWLTTVGADGTPQPNPVWFLWEGESVLTYNRPDAARVRHVRERPRVSVTVDGDGRGGGILVIVGEAEGVEGAEPADRNARYLEKYREHISRIGQDAAGFGRAYPVAIRIRPSKVRGF